METKNENYLPVPLKYTKPILLKFVRFFQRKDRANISSFNYYYVPEICKWVQGMNKFRETLDSLNISYVDWENRWILNSNIGSDEWISKVIKYRYKDKPINTQDYIKEQLQKDVNYECDFFIVKEDLIDLYKSSRENEIVFVDFDFSTVPDKLMLKSEMFVLKYNNDKLYKTNFNKLIIEKKDPKEFMKIKQNDKRSLGKEEFVRKANLIYHNKFNYDKTVYVNYTTPVIITCPIHGDFIQTPDSHLRIRKDCEPYACPKCAYENRMINQSKYKTLDEVIEAAKKVHPEYDYSECILEDSGRVNININTKIRIYCPIHKEYFWQTIGVYINQGSGCPKCGNAINGNTLKLEDFIRRSKQLYGNRYNYDLIKDFNNGSSTIVELIDNEKNSIVKVRAKSHLDCITGNPKDHISKGELLVENWLIENNLDYIAEDFISEVSGTDRGAFIDFTTKFNESTIWIEYNGIQHYEYLEHFHRDMETFKKRLIRDSNVRLYCKENNIRLIEIPYIIKSESEINDFLYKTIIQQVNQNNIVDYKQLYKINNCNCDDMLWPWI